MRKLAILFIGLMIVACTGKGKKDGEEMSHGQSVKLEQYMVEGQQLYNQYCSNCHQPNGEGLAKLYPPLKNSDYLKQNTDKAICSMKNGLNGEIVVNGVTYNQMMPGVPTLTELEIAEIATYIYNSWGNDKGMITIKQVQESLKNCN